MKQITQENVREVVNDGVGFRSYRTEMCWFTVTPEEPVEVVARDRLITLPPEGHDGLWQGLIALDSEGHPYPVEASIFYATYVSDD